MESIVQWMTEVLALNHRDEKGDIVGDVPTTRSIPTAPAKTMPADIRTPPQETVRAVGPESRDTRSPKIKHENLQREGPPLAPGAIVTWDSPLFGLLQGEVLTIDEHGYVEVYHPLAEAIARISRHWIIEP